MHVIVRRMKLKPETNTTMRQQTNPWKQKKTTVKHNKKFLYSYIYHINKIYIYDSYIWCIGLIEYKNTNKKWNETLKVH